MNDGLSGTKTLEVPSGSVTLMGRQWHSDSTHVVLLHAGVCDSRSWYEMARHIPEEVGLVAYDRRGYGETVASGEPYSDVSDLVAVLDHVRARRVWLVRSSAGCAIALDAALLDPGRLAGLVLLAPAVNGAPQSAVSEEVVRLRLAIDAADAADDLEEVNRLEAWLWLDGPSSSEARVLGPSRELMLKMNMTALRNESIQANGSCNLDTWSRLEEIDLPTYIAIGELDVPHLRDRSLAMTERLPRGQCRTFNGMAHLPYLENPALVAALITEAMSH